MTGKRGLTILISGLLVTGGLGCGALFTSPAARKTIQQTPPPAATGSETRPGTPVTGAGPSTAQPQQTSLSFDLFGIHKTYDTVTATVTKNAEGQPQTLIQATDGPNTLTMVVAGSGVGDHPVESVTIKDAKLGGQERKFDRSDPKLDASVTFTQFDQPTGRIAGTFTARYNGFPPISIQNGQLVAVPVPVQAGLSAAGVR